MPILARSRGLKTSTLMAGPVFSLPAVAMRLNAGQQQRLDPTFETLIPTNRCGFDVEPEPIVIMERGREGGSNLEHRQDGTANAILTPNGGRGGMGVGAIAYRNSGNCGAWETGDKVDTLTQSTDPNAHILAFDTTQVTSKANRSNPKAGDPCHPLAAGAHAPAVAWSIMPQNSGTDYKARAVDVAQPLMAGGPVGGNQGGDFIQDTWAVRRLTPTECTRLQGFPDHYPRITYRGKIAADGPIYKALGNSWAVPCGAWILSRTARAILAAKEKA